MFLLLYQTVLILKTSQYFVALSEKKKKKEEGEFSKTGNVWKNEKLGVRTKNNTF